MVSFSAFDGMTVPDNLPANRHYIRNVINIIILSFQLHQLCEHFPYDLRDIWKRKSSVPKWSYLLSRYGGLLTVAANVAFSLSLRKYHTVPRLWCAGWHFFQLGTGRLLWLLIEVTLIDRVIVMYKDYPYVKSFLISALMIWTAGSIAMASIGIFNAKVEGACSTHNAPIIVTFLALGALIAHLTIWVFAWKKRQHRRSILTTIIRDGNRGLGTMITLVILMVVINTLSNYNSLGQTIAAELYHAFFPIFITILSWTNCYLIKNLTKRNTLSSPNSPNDSQDSPEGSNIQFTTFNSFSVSTSTVSSTSTNSDAESQPESQGSGSKRDSVQSSESGESVASSQENPNAITVVSREPQSPRQSPVAGPSRLPLEAVAKS